MNQQEAEKWKRLLIPMYKMVMTRVMDEVEGLGKIVGVAYPSGFTNQIL